MNELDIKPSPSLASAMERASRAYGAGHFDTWMAALRAMLAADSDPTGPLGIHGLGRCDRCGESFRLEDERAEVAGDSTLIQTGAWGEPDTVSIPNQLIHVGCMREGEDIA